MRQILGLRAAVSVVTAAGALLVLSPIVPGFDEHRERQRDPREDRPQQLVIQLVYQQIENYVVYPLVYRRAVELSAFTTIVAVLIAGSLLGVVGAILAVPFAATIKIILREAGAPRRVRMAQLREADDAETASLADDDGALTVP